jgi:hypothetical protein
MGESNPTGAQPDPNGAYKTPAPPRRGPLSKLVEGIAFGDG